MQIDHHSNIQVGCLHVIKDPAPIRTQDSQQGRAVGRHQACKGGKLRVTRPARKGSWKRSTLQGRAVRGDQAGRGGKLGANRLAGEQLDIMRE